MKLEYILSPPAPEWKAVLHCTALYFNVLHCTARFLRLHQGWKRSLPPPQQLHSKWELSLSSIPALHPVQQRLS